MAVEKLLKLLYASKEYSMQGSILSIKDYYTGEKIKLDLSVLEDYPDVLEEMIETVESEEEDYE